MMGLIYASPVQTDVKYVKTYLEIVWPAIKLSLLRKAIKLAFVHITDSFIVFKLQSVKSYQMSFW